MLHKQTSLRYSNFAKYKAAACFVEFYGWFPYGRDVFLAMEYVPLGDLDKVLGQSKVVETEARDIGLQILTGLNIMHLESFAHRDLKPGVSTQSAENFHICIMS